MVGAIWLPRAVLRSFAFYAVPAQSTVRHRTPVPVLNSLSSRDPEVKLSLNLLLSMHSAVYILTRPKQGPGRSRHGIFWGNPKSPLGAACCERMTSFHWTLLIKVPQGTLSHHLESEGSTVALHDQPFAALHCRVELSPPPLRMLNSWMERE